MEMSFDVGFCRLCLFLFTEHLTNAGKRQYVNEIKMKQNSKRD